MEMRIFGRTGMQLSVLSFGCGAVGGLMVRDRPGAHHRAALAAGINYFDTAVQYGNGKSEKNLGRVLQRLKPANVAVGTKVRLPSSDFGSIADAVAKSSKAVWRDSRPRSGRYLSFAQCDHRDRRRGGSQHQTGAQ
jgi:aryl-alcohol dehydrogenase-like predicted oxidoreductase